MRYVRVLVDGYSLLHRWVDLASGEARHTVAARAALVRALTEYQDAIGVPVTVFFDGRGGGGEDVGAGGVEVLYSPSGKTADDLIERVTARLVAYGPVLVITDDHAERTTVSALGAHWRSCSMFLSEYGDAVREAAGDVARRNASERTGFSRGLLEDLG